MGGSGGTGGAVCISGCGGKRDLHTAHALPSRTLSFSYGRSTHSSVRQQRFKLAPAEWPRFRSLQGLSFVNFAGGPEVYRPGSVRAAADSHVAFSSCGFRCRRTWMILDEPVSLAV